MVFSGLFTIVSMDGSAKHFPNQEGQTLDDLFGLFPSLPRGTINLAQFAVYGLAPHRHVLLLQKRVQRGVKSSGAQFEA